MGLGGFPLLSIDRASFLIDIQNNIIENSISTLSPANHYCRLSCWKQPNSKSLSSGEDQITALYAMESEPNSRASQVRCNVCFATYSRPDHLRRHESSRMYLLLTVAVFRDIFWHSRIDNPHKSISCEFCQVQFRRPWVPFTSDQSIHVPTANSANRWFNSSETFSVDITSHANSEAISPSRATKEKVVAGRLAIGVLDSNPLVTSKNHANIVSKMEQNAHTFVWLLMLPLGNQLLPPFKFQLKKRHPHRQK